MSEPEPMRSSHYKNLKIEPREFISANNLNFFIGNVIKYSTRYPFKNGIEDLLKAIDNLEFEISRVFIKEFMGHTGTIIGYYDSIIPSLSNIELFTKTLQKFFSESLYRNWSSLSENCRNHILKNLKPELEKINV